MCDLCKLKPMKCRGGVSNRWTSGPAGQGWGARGVHGFFMSDGNVHSAFMGIGLSVPCEWLMQPSLPRRDVVAMSSTGSRHPRSSTWRHFTSAAGLAAVLPFVVLLLPFLGGQAPSVSHHGSLVVVTDAGKIEGKNAEGTDQFLGVPCAAPPVGALRWAAPRRAAPTYVYQFDDRNAPGLNNNLPGYQWGAGHAMELAYLWPSFNNGFSLYDLLTLAQLQLSHQMDVWWGAFARYHVPLAPGQPLWPPYSSQRMMSLRPGDQSQTISASTYAAQHQCAFWNAR
jgi:hypothetical protein